MSHRSSKIVLYTAPTPNGHKVSITLEELGLEYETKMVDMGSAEQKEPWFLAINPNGRVPALTDVLPDGTTIRLFESGSIQQYLVDRYDGERRISYPAGTGDFYMTNSWLFFQNAGIGAMQGQATHFTNYHHATEPQTYALERYVNESRRLWRTVDNHLGKEDTEYLVGSKCTVADIAAFSWANIAFFSGIDLSEFPRVQRWFNRLSERPAFQKGLAVPVKVSLQELSKDKAFLERNKEMIRQGMQEDRKK